MFNEYPYRNLTDVNLDYILKHIKELETNLQDFIKLNTIKYADPIDWNISKQYEANTVVVNEFTGVAYLSTQPVPAGVDVTNTDYWTPIFTLDFVNMNKNITLRNDGNNNNATFASTVGDWLIVGGQLYKVIQDISLHTAYVVGYNIQVYSVEMFVKDYLNQVLNLIGNIQDLNTTDKTNVVNAINSVLTQIGDLNDLTTSDKTSIVNAINSVLTQIGDLDDLETTVKTNIVNAINNVNAPEHIGYVTPQMFGAVGDNVNDDTTAIQNAINYAQNNGIGLVYIPKGIYKTTKPIVLPYGVDLKGASEYESTIHKATNGTVHLDITNPTYAPEIYIDTTVPDDVNAILVLTNDNGRYCGTIRSIGFVGDFANENNYESQIVDIGIFSTGSLSDFRLENCLIDCVRHGFLCQTIFVATIINNRIDHCLRGIGINSTSTSLFLSGNFVARARDYAYYLRSLYYSQISNNAADYFNYPTYYSDRTVQRACYTFRSCFNILITNNGCEQCIGIAYRFIECKGCTVDSNTALRLGSDYSGSGDIAFLYFNNNIQRCKIRNNIAYFYDDNGLIFGNAVAAKHHNIFFEGLTYVSSNEIENNIFSSTVYGVIQDEGWGNVVAPNINSVYGGRSFVTALPTLKAESMGDLSVVYGTNNVHYVEMNGKFKHVFGCFDVTITYTTAGGYFIVDSMPTNSSIDWRINVTGIESSVALSKQLKGFRLNGNGNSGIAFADDESIFRITDIPSGAHLLIYYDAYYQANNDR